MLGVRAIVSKETVPTLGNLEPGREGNQINRPSDAGCFLGLSVKTLAHALAKSEKDTASSVLACTLFRGRCYPHTLGHFLTEQMPLISPLHLVPLRELCNYNIFCR